MRISPRKEDPAEANPGSKAIPIRNGAFEGPFVNVTVAVPVSVSVPRTRSTGSGVAPRVIPGPVVAGGGGAPVEHG
jgi:hypothetical protein